MKDHFIRFVNICETSGASLTEVVLEVFRKYNISIMDCHGQGNDNGADMAGKNSGPQRQILNINSLAYRSNCANHCAMSSS